jgi:hypothetical protein
MGHTQEDIHDASHISEHFNVHKEDNKPKSHSLVVYSMGRRGKC